MHVMYAGRRLPTKTVLRKHAESHDENTRHQCNICGKVLFNKEGLERHVLTQHAGEKPHKCTLCGQGFTHQKLSSSTRRSTSHRTKRVSLRYLS